MKDLAKPKLPPQLTKRGYSKLWWLRRYRFEILETIINHVLDPPIPFTERDIDDKLGATFHSSLIHRELITLELLGLIEKTETNPPTYSAEGIGEAGRAAWDVVRAEIDLYYVAFDPERSTAPVPSTSTPQ